MPNFEGHFKKVVILGAGGIVGQHLMMSEPSDEVVVKYARRTKVDGKRWWGVDVEDNNMVLDSLSFNGVFPDVVVNLAGENRVDVVESNPKAYEAVNVNAPHTLAYQCQNRGIRFIQVSTQGVFSGNDAPYSPYDKTNPITEYGRQKASAEHVALQYGATVARLTFVLGARPFQDIGRRNPLEDMLEKPKQLQVDDRWFSPCFAHDAAKVLWDEILKPKGEQIFHIGHPFGVTRYAVARDLVRGLHGALQTEVQPISHEYFSGLAQRPFNTKWAEGSRFYEDYETSLVTSFIQWKRYTGA